jgi:hypothetical protein
MHAYIVILVLFSVQSSKARISFQCVLAMEGVSFVCVMQWHDSVCSCNVGVSFVCVILVLFSVQSSKARISFQC